MKSIVKFVCLAAAAVLLSATCSNSSSAGLLTWWAFDEPAGATSAADSAANGNIGVLKNFDYSPGSDFEPGGGKFGGAIHVDGANDYINNTTGFQPTGNFTYSWFFSPDSTITVGAARDDMAYSNARPHFSLSRDGSDAKLGMYFNISGDSQAKTTTDLWNAGTWYHIAWTYDGSTVKTYVDGVLESSVSRTGSHTVQGDGRFNLGSNAGGSAFDGKFDDLAIWDEALDPADIAFIAENGVLQFQLIPEPTTLLIWSLLAGLGVGLGWRRRK